MCLVFVSHTFTLRMGLSSFARINEAVSGPALHRVCTGVPPVGGKPAPIPKRAGVPVGAFSSGDEEAQKSLVFRFLKSEFACSDGNGAVYLSAKHCGPLCSEHNRSSYVPLSIFTRSLAARRRREDGRDVHHDVRARMRERRYPREPRAHRSALSIREGRRVHGLSRSTARSSRIRTRSFPVTI